jgi:hypothetical protein
MATVLVLDTKRLAAYEMHGAPMKGCAGASEAAAPAATLLLANNIFANLIDLLMKQCCS